jgi:hypothetical protein
MSVPWNWVRHHGSTPPRKQCTPGASWGSGGIIAPPGQFRAGFSEQQILKSFAAPGGVNPYSLTIYQIAIEFAKRYEPDFNRMGRPLGGAGAGNRALTIYMANQLSKRIKAEKIDQIEMQFLHPADTESLIYKYNNKPIIATTPASGYPIPVYRLRQVSGQN